MSSDTNKIVAFDGGSLLLVAFIVLKLCDVIDWSWWWVLSPLWIPLVLIAIVLAIAAPFILLSK